MKDRLATWLFPPLGLIRLWTRGRGSIISKCLSTAGILLYCVPYAALLLFLGVQTRLIQVEWRGGFPPVLTFHKTIPNYDAVEIHRVVQSAETPGGPLSNAPGRVGNWPGFRGPNRDGCDTRSRLRTNWPVGGLLPVWRQPVGGGYASFAIVEGRAFTIEQRRENEVVTAYDLMTGRELWAFAYPGRFDESMGGEGPRSTPACDGERVFALGATGEFHCLDAKTGALRWKKNILKENEGSNLTWAQSASPLVIGDHVIMTPGGSRGRAVVAYDKINGEPVWSALDGEAAYSSPMLVDLAGQEQILIALLDRIHGLDATDGSRLWEFPWVVQMNNRNIAQPVMTATNRFMLSAGYGTGSALVEVSRSPSGFAARQVWKTRNLKNKFSSSIYHEGHVYGLDEDILVCIDAGSGERRWKEGRYDYGQIMLADDQLIIVCGNGDVAIVAALPDRHLERTRFKGIHGKTWNHPAMSDGLLLIRNAVEMACFDLSADR